MSFQGVMSSCIILVSVCVVSCYCVCHFRVSCQAASFLCQSASCHVIVYMSFQSVLHFMLLFVFHVEVRCQPLSHQEFCHLNFHLPSSFDFIPSLYCLLVFCFVFVFYLPTPLKDKMMHVIKSMSDFYIKMMHIKEINQTLTLK